MGGNADWRRWWYAGVVEIEEEWKKKREVGLIV